MTDQTKQRESNNGFYIQKLVVCPTKYAGLLYIFVTIAKVVIILMSASSVIKHTFRFFKFVFITKT